MIEKIQLSPAENFLVESVIEAILIYLDSEPFRQKLKRAREDQTPRSLSQIAADLEIPIEVFQIWVGAAYARATQNLARVLDDGDEGITEVDLAACQNSTGLLN